MAGSHREVKLNQMGTSIKCPVHNKTSVGMGTVKGCEYFPRPLYLKLAQEVWGEEKRRGGGRCLFLNHMKDLVRFVSTLLGPFLSGDKTNPLFNGRSWFVQVLPRRMTLFNTLSGKTSPCLKRQFSLALSTTTPTSSHQIGLGEGPIGAPERSQTVRGNPQKTYLEAIHHRVRNLKRSPMKMYVRSGGDSRLLSTKPSRVGSEAGRDRVTRAAFYKGRGEGFPSQPSYTAIRRGLHKWTRELFTLVASSIRSKKASFPLSFEHLKVTWCNTDES